MHLFTIMFLLAVQWSFGQGQLQSCDITASWRDERNHRTVETGMGTPGLDVVNIARNSTVTIKCVPIIGNLVKFRIHVRTSESDSTPSYIEGGKLVMSAAHFVAGRYRCECQWAGQKNTSPELFLAGTHSMYINSVQ